MSSACSRSKCLSPRPAVPLPPPGLLTVCCRYGEVVNINLVRDKKTGKSKGFCFLCYEDQRSTILAVDNFNGIKVSEGAWDAILPACRGSQGAASHQTGALTAQVTGDLQRVGSWSVPSPTA